MTSPDHIDQRDEIWGDQRSKVIISTCSEGKVTMLPWLDMREILKCAGIIVSIAFAVVAFVYGLRAARTWKEASEVEIEHHWLMDSPEPETAHEFKITATMKAVWDSAKLNQQAAGFTKWAVVYGTAASVLSTATGLLDLILR